MALQKCWYYYKRNRKIWNLANRIRTEMQPRRQTSTESLASVFSQVRGELMSIVNQVSN